MSRPPAPLAAVAGGDHPILVPVVSLIYAGALAAGLLAIDQLSAYMPGPWFEVLAAAVLVLSLLSAGLLFRTAWRRHREGLDRRGLAWVGGAAAAVLLGLLSIYGLVESAQIASVISGADVRLTRPIIESLPQPPGTKLLDEHPGLADTESISEDFRANDLKGVVPFYETALAKTGWAEDTTSATTNIVRFTKGAYLVSVSLDPPSGDYTVIVDHISANLQSSPSPAPSPTP